MDNMCSIFYVTPLNESSQITNNEIRKDFNLIKIIIFY